jgi:hypothetical protein
MEVARTEAIRAEQDILKTSKKTLRTDENRELIISYCRIAKLKVTVDTASTGCPASRVGL